MSKSLEEWRKKNVEPKASKGQAEIMARIKKGMRSKPGKD